MTDIKSNLLGVFLSSEFDVSGMSGAELDYVVNNADGKLNNGDFIFFTGGTTQEFLLTIKAHDARQCPQGVISHLKYSRDIGSAFTIFKGHKNVQG